MDYKAEFLKRVNLDHLTNDPMDRISPEVRQVLNNPHCIDVHAHLFDIKCINESYFIIRMLKDALGLKSASEVFSDLSIEQAYNNIRENEDDWEEKMKQKLTMAPVLASEQNTKGIIDYLKAIKFLGFKHMQEVYDHYQDKFSLAKILTGKEVIVTALMMDLEIGWGVRLKKKLYDQVIELKALSQNNAVLPFFVCDPRRADFVETDKNLYSLFNLAFSDKDCFFGVKIYPALGYDPSDYRLWPIYEVCEQYKIPVLSHCGGESISTHIVDQLPIYEGDQLTYLTRKNRTDIAYSLNDPARWAPVLKKFPKLKLNLAHFGGYETWRSTQKINHNGQERKETIFEMMNTYENVYADFAYNLVENISI